MRALELHQQGWIQRDIAAALGATESAVSQWLASARRGGPRGPRLPHRPARRGSQADPRAGAPDPRFPLARSRGVWLPGRRLDLRPGRRCHPGGVRRHLQREPGVAAAQASGMDPAGPDHPSDPAGRGGDRAVAGRVVARVEGEGPPRASEACFRGRIGVLPAARRGQDLRPRGRTPIVDEWQTRDHLSVMGGVTPRGQGLHAGAAAGR